MTPTIGRIVIINGSPAIVTRVFEHETINATLFSDSWPGSPNAGVIQMRGIVFDAKGTPNTWNWPERV